MGARVYTRKLLAYKRCTGVGDDCGGAAEVDGGPDCRLQLLQGGNWLCSNSDSLHPHAQENNSADSRKLNLFGATLNLFFTFLTAKGNHLLKTDQLRQGVGQSPSLVLTQFPPPRLKGSLIGNPSKTT